MGRPGDRADDITERRARGRAAQRRYRSRKDQLIARLTAENQQLGSTLEKAVAVFLNFGDEITSSGSIQVHEKVHNAYRLALRDFRDLCREIESSDAGIHTGSGPDKGVISFSNTSLSDNHSPSRLETEVHARRSPTAGDPRSIVHDTRLVETITTNKAHRNMRRAPPIILQMPVQNSLSVDIAPSMAHLINQSTPFWARLLYFCLEMTARALQGHIVRQSGSSEWLLKSHTFSLRHARPSDLLWMTNSSMRGLALELQGAMHPQPDFQRTFCGPVQHFDSKHHQTLGEAIRRDMETSGLEMSEILGVHDVAPYLQQKGRLQLDENELRLHVNVLKHKNDAGGKVAFIELQDFLSSLAEGALCIGDAIGFPKDAVNQAVVRATRKLTDVNVLP